MSLSRPDDAVRPEPEERQGRAEKQAAGIAGRAILVNTHTSGVGDLSLELDPRILGTELRLEHVRSLSGN